MENINLNNIKGKRVLIVGMGKSGIAAIAGHAQTGGGGDRSGLQKCGRHGRSAFEFFGWKGAVAVSWDMSLTIWDF